MPLLSKYERDQYKLEQLYTYLIGRPNLINYIKLKLNQNYSECLQTVKILTKYIFGRMVAFIARVKLQHGVEFYIKYIVCDLNVTQLRIGIGIRSQQNLASL